MVDFVELNKLCGCSIHILVGRREKCRDLTDRSWSGGTELVVLRGGMVDGSKECVWSCL